MEYKASTTAMDSDFGIPRELSDLQKVRSLYEPEVPPCLQDEDNLRILQDSVDSNPDDPSLHFNLGLLLWEKEEHNSKEKAAEHFVISAKLNPLNGATFRYLGHYYATDDANRAIKCYQRAVSLNPDDFESGEAMCNLLDIGGKESLEAAFCREASYKSPRAFWAFRRLGFLQVHQNKWSEAVQSLQHAIRGYPSSADLWEALGLAYQRLGMFTAATKSYGRAIELENSRVFALVESGNILLMLGSWGKGVEQFRKALEISPQNASAYYGLASGLLGLSKECINLGAFKWAASLLEEASEVAKAGTFLAGNISCLWKLHGDILFTHAKCLPWAEEGRSLEFDEEAFLLSMASYKKSRCLAAMSSCRSYQRALHLAPWQPNIYTDIAIASDLICYLQESFKYDLNAWQLAEKMCLGGLLLEGDNSEFWVALGCLSAHNALKQHAFIRGLHLDVSLAVAWAYLGKLYRKEGEKQLASQAFDCARSIDPSLALPWAGMSADSNARETTLQEAYESCLRAVQILPLAEFQIGLAKLALLSGHLSSSQVYGAIRQAVQRAPHYPESHNLNGLVCEARFDYQTAASSYRLARYAISTSANPVPKSYFRDVSINLARSLSMAGNALDAVRECEDLKKEGLLNAEGLHVYALSLWQLGKKDLALSVARNLGALISSMELTSAAASIIFICRLLYYISGLEPAITSILKMPKDVFQSPKVSFIVSSIHSLDRTNRLQSVVSSSCGSLTSNEEITGMHFLISLSKLVKSGSEHGLNFQSGVDHLRKALHMYPNSTLIRNLLGYLLLFNKECEETHIANRFSAIDPSDCPNNEGLRSASEILGAGAIACYAIGKSNSRFSFPTCRYQCRNGPGAIQQLQKWLHREPWNHTARFLLILNILQKAREERFPRHLCTILERLILPAISNQFTSKSVMSYQYQKFQLLLCASETSLQGRDLISSINHAKSASELVLPDGYLFFAHLQLCRAYAIEDNSVKLRQEYIRCLELKTECHIGWISLKLVESRYKLETNSNSLDMRFEEFLKKSNGSSNMWMAVFTLVRGLNSLSNHDFLNAEELLGQACSLENAESCLFLCHGAVCLELARQQYDSQLLLLAVKSLTKGRENCRSPLPLVSALLAQAEGSLGSKAKWERNLHLEWLSWPPEMRPAELFFQMHLLPKQPKFGSGSSFSLKSCQSPLKWVLRAVHLNPSCLRYWKVLQKLTSEYAQLSCMQSGPGWE